MSIHQLLLILRARWLVIVATLLTVVALVIGISLVLPAKYKAVATVLVDAKSMDPILGALMPTQLMSSYMGTQMDIIQSDRVAQRVVRMLKIDQNPAAREQWMDDTGGKGSIQAYYADLLQKHLDVLPSATAAQSNIINISYKSTDPQFSAAVANAFAQAYIDTNLELVVDPAKQYAGWFDERLKGLRDQLEAAQGKLSAYQQEKGIINADEKLDVETSRLQELSTTLTTIEAQKSESQSRQAQAGNAETMPEVLQSGLVQTLKSQVAQQEQKLNDLRAQLGPNHPQVQSAIAQLQGLRSKLEVEIGRVAGGVGTSNRINVQRESEIRAALEVQKRKVLALKQQRDEISVLQREVDNAQKGYDLAAQRLVQTSLESKSSQTNISILSPAYEPTDPSFPKLPLNALIGVVMGLLLGVGLALLLELANRRVRSPDDLVEALGVPVIGFLDAAYIQKRLPRRRLTLSRSPAPRALPAPR